MAGPSGATTPLKANSKSHTPEMGSGLKQTGGCNVIQLTLNPSKNDHTEKACTSEDDQSEEVETRIRPSTEKNKPKDADKDALTILKDEMEARLRSLEGDKVSQKQQMVQKLMIKKMHEMLIEEIQLLGWKNGEEKEVEDS